MPLKNHSYPWSSSWRPWSQFFPYKSPPQLIQISSPLWSRFQPRTWNSRLPTFWLLLCCSFIAFSNLICLYIRAPTTTTTLWTIQCLEPCFTTWNTVSPQYNAPQIEQWLQGKGYSEFVFISTLCVQWWLQHYICTVNINLSRLSLFKIILNRTTFRRAKYVQWFLSLRHCLIVHFLTKLILPVPKKIKRNTLYLKIGGWVTNTSMCRIYNTHSMYVSTYPKYPPVL